MPPARRPVRLDSNESRRPFPPNDANSGPFQWRTAHFKYAHASELEEVLRIDDQAVDQAADRRDCGRVDHPDGGDIRPPACDDRADSPPPQPIDSTIHSTQHPP